jgi:hypothetical protein
MRARVGSTAVAVYTASALISAALLFSSQPALGQFSQQGPRLIGSGAVEPALQGTSVALSADGNTAIVGGPADNSGIGAVWVFTRSGGAWTQQGPKLVGSGAVGSARFGSSVALSADGNTAIVGGPQDDAGGGPSPGVGAAWVFTRSGGTWTQQGPKLTGTGAAGLASQGSSVALSADGDTAILGGLDDNSEAGATWVFTRNGGVWTQQGPKLVGTGAVGGAQQGYSVALSADGNTATVGGPWDNRNGTVADGATWVFTRSSGVWTQQGPKLVGTGAAGPAFQGSSVALSADGNTAIAGGYLDNGQVGAAWVFTHSGGAWTQQGPKLVGTGAAGAPEQGFSVALSADGNVALVGGPFDHNLGVLGYVGATWVFTRSGGIWAQQGAKLVGAEPGLPPGIFRNEGWSVALSADGNTAILGVPQANANGPGAAWVFVQLPTVAHVTPNSGPSGGGTNVTITGTGFTGTTAVTFGGAAATNLVLGDSNTIAVKTPPHAPGAVDVAVTNSIGTGTGTGAYVYAAPTCTLASQLGDLNGDGRDDIVFRGTGFPGTVAVYLMNGFQIVSAQAIINESPDYTLAAVADFNGDGKADILFRRASDGLMAIYLMDGFQLVAAQLIGAVGTDIAVVGLGDFNGDGRSDILFRRPSDGLLAMYLMNGFQVVAAQALGAVGTDFNTCYGQPPFSPARVNQR